MTDHGILERVQELELAGRAARRWRMAWLLAGLAIGLVAPASGQERVSVLRCERLELVDKNGQVVGVFGTEYGHRPFVELSDPAPEGTPGSGGRVRLDVDPTPELSLRDRGGKVRVQLCLGNQTKAIEGDRPGRAVVGQIPQLCFMDSEERLRTTLGSENDESSKLVMRDGTGKVIVRIPE